MEIDTSNLTDEQISRLGEFIQSMEKLNKSTKWWIVPKYNLFSNEEFQFDKSYVVEEQKDSYSKNKPPLKSDFNSKEEAEKWLKNYLEEEKIFNSAIMQIDNLGSNLSMIKDKLEQHKMVSEDDWTECFRMFNESRINGELAEVTK